MKKLTSVLLAAVTAVAIFAWAGAAHAQDADDDDDAGYDTKILRGLMSGLGLKRDGEGPGIDYRERSPLVLPPSRDLPQPETDAAPKDPNWPTDQDVQRRKEARKARKNIGGQNYNPEDEARALSPSEMTPGAKTARRGSAPQSGRDKDSKETEPGDTLSVFDLGYKGNLLSGMFGGSDKTETAKFESEPPRGSLTDPPVGYRTPSAAQPYGVTPDRLKPKAMDIYDRQTPEDLRK